MSGIVRFNVGGREFATSRSTIAALGSENMLATMVARHEDGSLPSADIGGALFIDRDPACFGIILNFLRTGKVFVPRDVPRAQLREEMEFYGISDPLSSSAGSGASAASSCDGDLEMELDAIVSEVLGDKVAQFFTASGRALIGPFVGGWWLDRADVTGSVLQLRTSVDPLGTSDRLMEEVLVRVRYEDLVKTTDRLNAAVLGSGTTYKLKQAVNRKKAYNQDGADLSAWIARVTA